MAKIIDNLTGFFIATVVGYDTSTRELDVFIPKLMPLIPDGRKDVSLKTNLGNNRVEINYNDTITMSSSIKVRAEDKDEPLPEVGSKVLVHFLDDRFELGFWYKFNVNGDYKIIETEKYKKLNTIYLNETNAEIYEDDNIIIELPEGFSVVKQSNPFKNDEKTKYFKIEKDSITENRISKLESLVGNPREVGIDVDNNGKEKEVVNISSGIFKSLEKTNNEISDINFKLGSNGLKTVYKKIENFEKYSPKVDYYIFNGEDYTVPPLDEAVTIEGKTNILLTLQNESGYDLYEGLEEATEPSGIYGKIFSLALNLEKLKNENSILTEELETLRKRVSALESKHKE